MTVVALTNVNSTNEVHQSPVDFPGDWYAAIVKPGEHHVAAENLRRQGYAVSMPMCRREVRHARKALVAVAPLFDRYVFVGCPEWLSVRSIAGTRGVSCLVTTAGGAARRLSAGDLAVLRAVEARALAGGGEIDLTGRTEDRAPRWHPGQSLTITEGAFGGFVGLFQRFGQGGQVARVLIDLFGRPTPVDVAVDGVSAR